jgi:hypothetical protein
MEPSHPRGCRVCPSPNEEAPPHDSPPARFFRSLATTNSSRVGTKRKHFTCLRGKQALSASFLLFSGGEMGRMVRGVLAGVWLPCTDLVARRVGRGRFFCAFAAVRVPLAGRASSGGHWQSSSSYKTVSYEPASSVTRTRARPRHEPHPATGARGRRSRRPAGAPRAPRGWAPVLRARGTRARRRA